MNHKRFNIVVTASNLKWRGKNNELLPTDAIYRITWDDALAAGVLTKNAKSRTVTIHPPVLREWLVVKFKSDYGKKPSNKFWFYISLENV